jgi:hypothetical protein
LALIRKIARFVCRIPFEIRVCTKMLIHILIHAVRKNLTWARTMKEIGHEARFERMKFASDNVGMFSRLLFLSGILAFMWETAIKALSSDGLCLDIAILFLLGSLASAIVFYAVPMISFLLNELVDLAEEAEDEELVGLTRPQIRRRASYIISLFFIMHIAAFWFLIDHLMS